MYIIIIIAIAILFMQKLVATDVVRNGDKVARYSIAIVNKYR